MASMNDHARGLCALLILANLAVFSCERPAAKTATEDGPPVTSLGDRTGEADATQSESPPPLTQFVQRIEGTTVEFTMVPISAGVLRSDTPDGHEPIDIPSFYVGQTEVTWDLFDVFVYGLDVPEGDEVSDAVTRPSKPYVPPDRGFGHAGYPAISMTHQSAQKFCEWLSTKTGRRYRLPTEAEWAFIAERCANGGEITDREWFRDNSDSQTHAVAQKLACPEGIYDLLGNAAEWTMGISGKPIVCGGAYSDDVSLISAATRRSQTSAWNMSDPQMPKSKWWLPDAPFVGFRLVCDVEEGEANAGDGTTE